jgi:hypothetical protein
MQKETEEKYKGVLEDLQKARWFLNKLILAYD